MTNTAETNNQAVQYIPLSKLEKSPLNVRKTAASCDDLIANIRVNGLMQNLSAYPGKKGKYLVFAGGRRLAALKALQAEGHFPESEGDFAVPCQIYTQEQAAELSLAENTVRVAMHPADRFEAFNDLIVNHGMTAEQVAIRFGVTVKQVERDMRMARIAPALIQAYRDEEMPYESLMAFAVVDDHSKQIAVYESLSDWQLKRPNEIRDRLTEEMVKADNKLAVFVGLDTYEKAGGTIRTDLTGESFLENPELLNALVTEKLKLAEQELLAEAWGWVQVAQEQDWKATQGCSRIKAEPVDVPQELIEAIEAAETKVAAIEKEAEEMGDDEWPDDFYDRQRTAEESLDALNEEIATYAKCNPDQMKTAGAYAYIAHNGTLNIDKGLVKKQDAKKAAQMAAGATDDDQPVEKPKGFPESLKRDLESYRLQVAQAEIAKNPHIAFDLMVYSVAKGVLGNRHVHDGVDISFRQHWGTETVNKQETSAGNAMEAVKTGLSLAWLEANPIDEVERFRLFMGLSEAEKHAILAYCVATTLQPKLDSGKEPTAYDTALALTGGDVAAYWRPNATNFLSRVTSSQLLEIGQEIFGGNFTTQYGKSKKGELVTLLDKGFANPDKAMDREKVNRLMNWLPVGMAFGAAPDAEPKPAKGKKKKAA